MAVGPLPPAGRGPSHAYGLAWASCYKLDNIRGRPLVDILIKLISIPAFSLLWLLLYLIR